MNKTFNIASADAFDKINNDEDKKFLQQQLDDIRIGCIGSVDLVLASKEKRKQQRENNQERRKLAVINQQQIHNQFSQLSDSDSEQVDHQDLLDPDFIEPSTATSTRPKKIKLISEQVVSSIVRTNTSAASAFRILAPAVESMGYDLNDVTLSQSSLYRATSEHCSSISDRSDQVIKQQKKGLTLHWDGKSITTTNDHQKNEYLAIYITRGNEYEQLIGCPRLDGQDATIVSEAVSQHVIYYDLIDKIIAICTDNAAVNTGSEAGAIVLIETGLKRRFLRNYCRKHILELIVKEVFNKLFGSTISPSPPDFVKFKSNWTNIDKSKYQAAVNEPLVSRFITSDVRDQLIEFYKLQLDINQTRADYAEAAELALYFLDCNLENASFKLPGAMHHARWLSKIIYCIKMFIFRGELNLLDNQVAKLEAFCLFIIQIYLKNWYDCSKPARASNNDLQLLKEIYNFRKIDQDIADAALKSISNHLIYLDEIHVALAFFDTRLSAETKAKMIKNLNKECPNVTLDSKNIWSINFDDVQLEDLVSRNTLDFFNICGLDSSFLIKPIEYWSEYPAYESALKCIENLSIVNDVCERGVHMADTFKNRQTKNSDSWQDLLKTVSEDRKNYTTASKAVYNSKWNRN